MTEQNKKLQTKDLLEFSGEHSFYDNETVNILEQASEVFDFYKMKSESDLFMTPEEIQIIIRKLTSLVAIISVRLGHYDFKDMSTYWNKNIIRATKRKELHKNKKRDNLTEKMIESMSDTSEDYMNSVEDHIFASDFANRLKLVMQSARIMLDSLSAEQIRLQVEMKYAAHQK